jgi:peptidoglycan/LPS O-acetylase OafA/YrhL
VAALMVVAYHYLDFAKLSLSAVAHGDLGVSFFFILSGFILSHVYAEYSLDEPASLSRFAVSRFARLYPAYIFAYLLSLPAVIDRGLDFGFTPFDYAALVLAPLSLQAWVPGAGCVVNCPGWSISVEVFFYALFPLLLVSVRRRPLVWLGVTLVLWGAVVAIALGLLAKPAPSLEAADRLHQLVLYFPPMRLPEFLLGIVLHTLTSRPGWRLSWPVLILAAVGGFLLLELLIDFLPRAVLNLGASAVFWAPLILVGASVRRGPLCHPLAVFLGKASYGLYLLHAPIALYADFVDRRFLGGAFAREPWALAGVSFVLALAAAVLLHLMLEDPLRRRIGGRRSVPALPLRRAA